MCVRVHARVFVLTLACSLDNGSWMGMQLPLLCLAVSISTHFFSFLCIIILVFFFVSFKHIFPMTSTRITMQIAWYIAVFLLQLLAQLYYKSKLAQRTITKHNTVSITKLHKVQISV